MSIADKLIQITENLQKIHDKAYRDGFKSAAEEMGYSWMECYNCHNLFIDQGYPECPHCGTVNDGSEGDYEWYCDNCGSGMNDLWYCDNCGTNYITCEWCGTRYIDEGGPPPCDCEGGMPDENACNECGEIPQEAIYIDNQWGGPQMEVAYCGTCNRVKCPNCGEWPNVGDTCSCGLDIIQVNPDIITFYVNGEAFTAESGMTWEEFICSDYNPTFVIEDCCNEEKHHFDWGYNQEDDVYYTNSCCGPAEGIIFSDNGWMTKYEEIQSGGEYFASNEY